MTHDTEEPSAASAGSLAWISVRDRLPNENRVLIFCPLLEPDETVAATRYKSGLWICDDGQMLGAGEPTHWMNLPEPPTDAK
jgi:hypothetical protein